MDNIEIGKRIKYARDMENVTLNDIAIKIGVAKSTIQRYENGKIKKLKIPVLHSIANALNVNPGWLVGKSEEMSSYIKNDITTIDVLSGITNTQAENSENIIDTEVISEDLACTGDFFALKIHGDSMEPRMLENDIVIIHKQNDAKSGDLIIVSIDGNDAICKKLIKYEHGISLVSLNSKYEPEYFSNNEIINKSIKILGKVVEFRAKFN